MNILIKPHHLLDIFKLYGKGIAIFEPDIKYNHDFYKVANAIIERKVKEVQFTVGYDDICKPCIYLKGNTCHDMFLYKGIEYNKNNYNLMLDKKIFNILRLKDEEYSMKEVLSILKENITFSFIKEVWYDKTDEENSLRYTMITKGINKYLLLEKY